MLNTLTVSLAATVPWLDLLVSLVGAIIMSTQSIMIPAIIDTAAHWNSDSRAMFLYRQTGTLSTPHRVTDSEVADVKSLLCHKDTTQDKKYVPLLLSLCLYGKGTPIICRFFLCAGGHLYIIS